MQYRVWLMSIAAIVATSGVARAQDDARPEGGQELSAAPSIAPHARAVPPGFVPDAVYLKNGGLLRGAVIESAPGDHVTIALPSGDVRRLAWSEIERVAVNEMSRGASAPIASPPPAPSPKIGPLARVHIAADPSVLLDRRPAGSDTWVPACAAPCDEELPLDDEYRLSGPGMRSSNVFRLQGEPGGRVDLSVNPSTKLAWWVGAGIGGMGLIVDAYAAYVIALSAALTSAPCGSYETSASCQHGRDVGRNVRNVGLVMLIPGTAAAIVGGGMMLANWRTGIVQGKTEGPTSAPLDAWKRSPEARERLPGTSPDVPEYYFPLASGRF